MVGTEYRVGKEIGNWEALKEQHLAERRLSDESLTVGALGSTP